MNPPQQNQALEPYLFFDGRCEEAIEFYRKALDARIEGLMRFKENPEPSANPPGSGEKIMHASLLIGESRVMVSDGRCQGRPSFQGFALALTALDEAQAKGYFSALSDGGQVQMPLTKTFFSPL